MFSWSFLLCRDYYPVLQLRKTMRFGGMRVLFYVWLGFARCFDLFHTFRPQRPLPQRPVLQLDFFEDDAEALASDWRKILPPECFPPEK